MTDDFEDPLGLSEAEQSLCTAQALAERGDYVAGVAAATEAVTQSAQAGSPLLQARAATLLVLLLYRTDAVEEAIVQGRRALDILPKETGAELRAELLGTMSMCFKKCSLVVDALEFALSALDQARLVDKHSVLCTALCRVAAAYTDTWEPARAESFARQALALARIHHDDDQAFRAINTLVNSKIELGDAQLEAGQVEAAQASWTEAVKLSSDALALNESCINLYRNAVGLVNHGVALSKAGRDRESLVCLDRASEMARRNDFPQIEEVQVTVRTRALVRLGRGEEALPMLTEALVEAGKHGDLGLEEQLHEHLYLVHKSIGQLSPALHHHEQLLGLQRRSFRNRESARMRILHTRAEMERLRVDADGAKREFVAERERLATKANEFERYANEDALTGLQNRRAVDNRLLDLVRQNDRLDGTQYCLAILDLDHFKDVNDGYGHAVGDDVLRDVGALLRSHVREPDFVGRFGGEEFVAVLQVAKIEHGLAACERLRIAIEQHEWSMLAAGLNVTASMGVTMLLSGEDVRMVVQRADRALYQAKQRGRNRTVAEDPDRV